MESWVLDTPQRRGGNKCASSGDDDNKQGWGQLVEENTLAVSCGAGTPLPPAGGVWGHIAKIPNYKTNPVALPNFIGAATGSQKKFHFHTILL